MSPEPSWSASLARLRASGFAVAVHHDYLQDGLWRSFWLLTSEDGTYLRSEDATAGAALARIVGERADADASAEEALTTMHQAGWRVAIHNDFRMRGMPCAFWRFVRPETASYVDGEGLSDAAALSECLAAAGMSVSDPGGASE